MVDPRQCNTIPCSELRAELRARIRELEEVQERLRRHGILDMAAGWVKAHGDWQEKCALAECRALLTPTPAQPAPEGGETPEGGGQ